MTTEKISYLCDQAFNKIDAILDYFNINYIEYHNRLVFPCPIHNGDNLEGCCIFTDGLTHHGNWACWTQHCEEEYVSNLFGFVRGCLSQKENRDVSMNETAAFMVKFLQADFNNVPKLTKHNDNTLDVFSRKISRKSYNIDRETIRSRIQIPSEYYIKRGFDPSTLDEFDIGECIVKKQPMSGRVVVPVYDEENNYVGCVGRSLTDNMQPKWLHSKGFTKNVLYGMNIAKQHILSTGTAILVEGQGDVWKMHQAGLKMTVGIFGSSLNEDQLILLEMSGALNIVILTDSDDAGANAYKQIMKKCGRRFNYVRPTISKKDVGEMSVEEIKDELYPQLKGIINEH